MEIERFVLIKDLDKHRSIIVAFWECEKLSNRETGPILSVYFLDPDGNLIEVANCIDLNTSVFRAVGGLGKPKNIVPSSSSLLGFLRKFSILFKVSGFIHSVRKIVQRI